jgi:hypothetical protein
MRMMMIWMRMEMMRRLGGSLAAMMRLQRMETMLKMMMTMKERHLTYRMRISRITLR